MIITICLIHKEWICINISLTRKSPLNVAIIYYRLYIWTNTDFKTIRRWIIPDNRIDYCWRRPQIYSTSIVVRSIICDCIIIDPWYIFVNVYSPAPPFNIVVYNNIICYWAVIFLVRLYKNICISRNTYIAIAKRVYIGMQGYLRGYCLANYIGD